MKFEIQAVQKNQSSDFFILIKYQINTLLSVLLCLPFDGNTVCIEVLHSVFTTFLLLISCLASLLVPFSFSQVLLLLASGSIRLPTAHYTSWFLVLGFVHAICYQFPICLGFLKYINWNVFSQFELFIMTLASHFLFPLFGIFDLC